MSVRNTEYSFVIEYRRSSDYNRFLFIDMSKIIVQVIRNLMKTNLTHTTQYRAFSDAENSKTLFDEDHMQYE